MSQKKITTADIVNSSLINVGDVSSGSLTEMVVNGTMPSGTTGWTLTGGAAYSSGIHGVAVSSSFSSGTAYQDIAVAAGYYVVSFTARYTGGSGEVTLDIIGGAGSGSTYLTKHLLDNPSPQTYTDVIYLPSTETIRYQITINTVSNAADAKTFSLIYLGTNTIYSQGIYGGSGHFSNLYQNSFQVIDSNSISAQSVNFANSAGVSSNGGNGFTFADTINDLGNVVSIDPNNRTLNTSTGMPVIYWDSKDIVDSADNSSIEWENRILYANDGTTVQMNYSDASNPTIADGTYGTTAIQSITIVGGRITAITAI